MQRVAGEWTLASVPARREMAGSSSYTVRVRIWSAGLRPLRAARAANFCPTCVTSDDDYDSDNDYDNVAGTVASAIPQRIVARRV